MEWTFEKLTLGPALTEGMRLGMLGRSFFCDIVGYGLVVVLFTVRDVGDILELWWGVGDKSYDGEISVIKVPGTAGVRYHYLEPRLDRRDRRQATDDTRRRQ